MKGAEARLVKRVPTQSHPNGMPTHQFLAVGEDRVQVTNENGDVRLLSRDLALRLHLNRPRAVRRPAPLVVLSFAVPGAEPAPSAYVCVHSSEAGDEDDYITTGPAPPTDWPDVAWAGYPPPWTAVPGDTWVPLPDPGLGDAAVSAVLARCERDHRYQEQCVAQGLDKRCQAIVEHGEQEDFTASLDYCLRWPYPKRPPPMRGV